MRLVGRAGEVARILAAIDHRRPVVVVGPPGIGKTALVTAALANRPTLVGTAVAGLRWRAYTPLSMAVGRGLTGPPDQIADEVTNDVGDDVLVIDDLQWADPATLTVLDRLAGAVALVVTLRADEPRPGWTAPAEIVDVRPLRDRAARTLASRLHPDLAPSARSALVRTAGGNPLLLAHLVVDHQPTPTLLAAARARLASLPSETAERVVEVALLGRPIDPATLDLDPAMAPAFLVTDDEGRVLPTHALVADAALAGLDAPALRATHRRLAAKLPSGDAAGHLLAAGDREAALLAARAGLAATTDLSRRAQLLSIAADAGDDDGTRLEAATALLAVADFAGAARVAADVGSNDPQVLAEAALLAGQSHWFAADPTAARAALARGIALVDGTRTPTEARLRVEDALQRVRIEEGSGTTGVIGRAALEIALATSTEVTKARMVVAMSMAYDGTPGWEDAFRDVVAEAAQLGEHDLECAASFFYVSQLGLQARAADAVAELEPMMERALELGRGTWYTHMRGASLTDRFLIGDEPGVLSVDATAFVEQSPRFRNIAQVRLVQLISLADEDRGDDVRAASADAFRMPVSDEDRTILEGADAESAWMVRDHALAISRAEVAARRGRGWFGIDGGAVAAGAHALFELDRPIHWAAPTDLPMPLFALLSTEVDLLRAAQSGGAATLDELDAAARRWDGAGIPRYATRMRWAAALLAFRHSHRSAQRRLVAVERESRGRGWTALARRASSTLDLAARHAEVTTREADVLQRVAAGSSSTAIAVELGLERTTVESHVTSAMRRLGARTRRRRRASRTSRASRSTCAASSSPPTYATPRAPPRRCSRRLAAQPCCRPSRSTRRRRPASATSCNASPADGRTAARTRSTPVSWSCWRPWPTAPP